MNPNGIHKFVARPLKIFWAVLLLAMSLAVDLAAGQGSHLTLANQNSLPIIYKSTFIYVDADATGNNNGSSWADAYTSLQTALESATVGSQIWVAAGTYYPSVEACGTGSDRYKTFQLRNGVAVYGGFDPSIGDVNWWDRDWVVNTVILSGDIGIPGDNIDNSYHVFCHPEGLILDSSATLDGFVIEGGNANSTDFVNVFGGGMHNWDTSSPTLNNITFSNNSAYTGGGLFTTGSSRVTNVIFSDNSATDEGGGMVGLSSSLLSKVTFSHNSAANYGGGLSLRYGLSPTLNDVNFSDNSAGLGGGFYNASYTPMLTNITFSNNSAGWDGGGIFNDTSFPILVNVTFTGNTSIYGGGGMYNKSGSPTLVNVIFSGNIAVVGGGIYNSWSGSTLVNVTFSGNRAVNGGGIYNINADAVMTNCILWGNEADEIFNDTSSAVVTYSDVQGGFSGEGNIDADPLFVDAPGGNLRLQSISPAIDAGDNTTPELVGITTDLDGNPRFVDILTIPDTGFGTAPIVDMGAYEAQDK